MSTVLPQVALHRVIWEGLQILRQKPEILDKIFAYYCVEPIARDYGEKYINNIKTWLLSTEIPVVQAWSLNPQQAPQVAIKLASEQEDISKSAIGDHFGMGSEADIGVGVFSVSLEILIMAPKNSDESLWLYYLVNYILFKRKRYAERLGLQMHTFSASDHTRDAMRLADNLWVRTIRFNCIVENFWEADEYLDFDNVELELAASSANTEIEVDI